MNYDWIFKKSCEIENKIIEWRRVLHTLAEIQFKTDETKKFIITELRTMGLKPRLLGGGVVCEISGTMNVSLTNNDENFGVTVTHKSNISPKSNKCVLLRADIDALPLCEMTSLTYKATNGNMHACGHDMHTASLLGAAFLLSKNKNKFKGIVKLVFQSAEEILSGANKMIKEGVLKEPNVNACVGLHVVLGTEYETGTAIVPNGGMSAPFADFFKITIKGVGGHGAIPEKSKNAALCGAAIIVSIDELIKNSARGDFSLSICQVDSGTAPNIIPDKCEIFGTLRSLSNDVRARAIQELNEICKHTSALYGCESKFETTSSSNALFCNKYLAKITKECLKALYSARQLGCIANVVSASKEKIKPSTPSEDFASFAERAPSVLVGLCAGKISDGFSHPLHTPRTIFDERALVYGASIYTALAVDFLDNNINKSKH